jgi:hypothetical protein
MKIKMLSLREINYDTEQSSDQLFSRLTWMVEKVDGLAWELFRNYSTSTNKPWIGVYNSEKKEFGLLEPRGVFTMMPFRVVVRGKITSSDNKTYVNIKLRLSLGTILNCALIYVMTALAISSAINSPGADATIPVVIWILVFPGCGILLLRRKLSQIEQRIESLLGLI